MRLMSLVDLASHESGRVPYALIKDTLRVMWLFSFPGFHKILSSVHLMSEGSWQINDDEVEQWVVKAITAKLIDCKMDQMNEVLLVR